MVPGFFSERNHLHDICVLEQKPLSAEMKPVIILLIPALVLSCEKASDKELPSEPVQLNLPEKAASIIESDNTFGFNIFKQVIENDQSENIFISPTSIALALAMTYNGAEGETKAAFETALSKQGLSREDINASYKALIGALKSVDPRVVLEIANSIWYRDSFTVLQDFINVNKEYYDAEVQSMDFNDPVSVEIINTWVKDNTNRLIDKIIEDISPEVVMYLINAVYFKGMWKFKFDKNKTVGGDFHLKNGGTVNNDFMKQTAVVPYMSYEKFAMAELPYGQGNYSMMVLLPNKGFTTNDIVADLTSENWNNWISSMNEREIEIEFPKLKFSYKNLLNDELTNLGMGVAFTDYADFTGINAAGGLLISRVIHKSFVNIDEEGTEAAAVTAVEVELTSSPPPPLRFVVNHPYLFALRETTTGAILFLGLVQNPTIEENGQI